MSDRNAQGRHGRSLNPQALSLEDAAMILSAAGSQRVTIQMLQADIDAGAPTGADGTLNLVHYAAWLVREISRRV
ncbi:hypothetical protein [Thermostilla marina]